METLAEAAARGIKQGKNAARFDANFGTDETPDAQAVRRKQGERYPNIWADSFVIGYRQELAQAELVSDVRN